jgi:hypothetical protein
MKGKVEPNKNYKKGIRKLSREKKIQTKSNIKFRGERSGLMLTEKILYCVLVHNVLLGCTVQYITPETI